jgi:serine/threonine-protein kinase RsbW
VDSNRYLFNIHAAICRGPVCAYHSKFTALQENAMPADTPPTCEFDPAKLILSLDMSIACEVKAIAPVIRHIMDKIKSMGCAEGKEFEVETSIREALVNAVMHGCEEDPECTVQISVACDESRGMLVVVRDPGPGFDPEQIPSPVRGRQLFAEHGRGIYLISQLMDEVSFERGGTEIRMRKA